MSSDWHKQRDRFDRDFDDAKKVTVRAMGCVSVGLLALLGVVIWAIVRIVLAYT